MSQPHPEQSFTLPVEPAQAGRAITEVRHGWRSSRWPLLLVTMFIFSGVMKLMDPSMPAEMIASKGLPAPELLAYAAGALEVLAGVAIAVGWMTAPSAIALAAFTLIAGVLFHDFWNYTGQEGQMQMQAFMKNIAIVGGFLVLAAHGPGRFAIGHHPKEPITANPGKLGMA